MCYSFCMLEKINIFLIRVFNFILVSLCFVMLLNLVYVDLFFECIDLFVLFFDYNFVMMFYDI